MRLPSPPWPELPDEQKTRQRVSLRYEDVCQDGRLLVSALAPLYGAVAWRELLPQGPVAEALRVQGVIPILSRMVLDGTPGSFSPSNPLDVSVGYDLGHSVDERGEVARLHLRLWGEVHGPRGHAYEMHGTPGPEQLAGRVYAEHVFTRLFAPPAERKVLRLDVAGLPPVPPTRIAPLSPAALLALPEGAEPLGDVAVDPVPVLFSLGHTDSNQHVNSLVYPRIFEEAALRRLHQSGVSGSLLVRHADCLYRKPFFAGDVALLRLRAFRLGAALGVAGVFVPSAEGPDGRPSVVVRVLFEA